MSDWKPKRFWDAATVELHVEGFTVHLDGRAVKTPAKAALVVPTVEMAQAIAQEWDAQDGVVDPSTMPVTRGANAAIDKVAPQKSQVVAMLAEYGDTDLLCYRAAEPETLVARQAAGWDPMLDWAATALDARLQTGEGVIHVPQHPDVLSRLYMALDAYDPFELAGVHDLVSISGSLVLALAVTNKAILAQEAWALSRIDEHWQAEQWGADEEASAQEMTKRAAFLDAARFFELAKT